VVPRFDAGRGAAGRDGGGSSGKPVTAGAPVIVLGDDSSPVVGEHRISIVGQRSLGYDLDR
jgi:hypothetical protein